MAGWTTIINLQEKIRDLPDSKFKEAQQKRIDEAWRTVMPLNKPVITQKEIAQVEKIFNEVERELSYKNSFYNEIL